jgi:hypothetical protein
MGLTNTTIKAVQEWQDKLNSATNSHKFDLHITTMSNVARSLDHYYCDVIILYNTNLPFENVAGITHPVNVWRTFNVINIVYGNSTDENFTNWPKDYLVKVTEHELGHAFGLDHLQSKETDLNTTCDSPEKLLSIMYWCIPVEGDWQKMSITKYDVNAVLQRYNDPGFGELNSKAGSSYALTNIVKIADTRTENNTTSTMPKPQTLVENSQTTAGAQSHGIPNWVKNNAHYWSVGNIGDDDFVKGIQYMIQQKIITIPSTTQGSSSQATIPSWVKKDAGWWSVGVMSDDDFIKAIQYLITNGIISP